MKMCYHSSTVVWYSRRLGLARTQECLWKTLGKGVKMIRHYTKFPLGILLILEAKLLQGSGDVLRIAGNTPHVKEGLSY